ncbi:hypothetical protein [Frateuria sp. STR12]|uniref:hypothetical protein n=1 Tax=Frateuria hangzhouensis TaxID=2995589 RepID=UPI002260CD58|nr:hypothetical protein [Frateuria sp. STR12]MCX7513387.1 hypothetical protein [Frateuria sp. STR12]
MSRTRFLPALLALLSLSATGGGATPSATAAALTPALHAGAVFGNVFSRTIALQAPGFDDAVRRVSGTATYRVLDATTTPPQLRIDYHYDGRPAGSGTVVLPDEGATNCYDGKCAPNTDASGLAYNPLLWGRAPATLRVGQRWTVDIGAPWELGPAGRQTVTVVALDPASHTVSLEREGSGNGPWLGDAPQLALTRGDRSYPVTRQSGRAHWHGRTTFRDGIVLSDELVSTRPVTLASAQLGRIEGVERQYILLNATPGEAAR